MKTKSGKKRKVHLGKTDENYCWECGWFLTDTLYDAGTKVSYCPNIKCKRFKLVTL